MGTQQQINGIRLSHDFIQLGQETDTVKERPLNPLYLTLGSEEINLVLLILNLTGGRASFCGLATSGQTRLPSFDGNPDMSCCEPVSTVSVFPHRGRLELLGTLLSCAGDRLLSLSSSHAMISLVVRSADSKDLADRLCESLGLPDSKIIVEQPEDKKELSEFIRRRYPQTRAVYVEDKIKTYGIDIRSNLNLGTLTSDGAAAMEGLAVQLSDRLDSPLIHASGSGRVSGRFSLGLVTENPIGIKELDNRAVDLVSFYGPHYGDRYGIAGRALECLFDHGIRVWLAGCAGASVTVAVDKNQGKPAGQALSRVFEIPGQGPV